MDGFDKTQECSPCELDEIIEDVDDGLIQIKIRDAERPIMLMQYSPGVRRRLSTGCGLFPKNTGGPIPRHRKKVAITLSLTP